MAPRQRKGRRRRRRGPSPHLAAEHPALTSAGGAWGLGRRRPGTPERRAPGPGRRSQTAAGGGAWVTAMPGLRSPTWPDARRGLRILEAPRGRCPPRAQSPAAGTAGSRWLTLGTHTHAHTHTSPAPSPSPLSRPGAQKPQGDRERHCAWGESGCRGLAAPLLPGVPVHEGAPAACSQAWGFRRVLPPGKWPGRAGTWQLCCLLSGVRGEGQPGGLRGDGWRSFALRRSSAGVCVWRRRGE